MPSSLAMAAANIGEIVLPIARGVGLARLLTPEQFGLALTITVTAGILELITDLGTGQLALRLDSGLHLHTLHSVAVIRGIVLGLIIAACGPVFGMIFHTEGAAWIYGIVGLSSVIRGLAHLEIKANMRHYNYLGEALFSISGQVAWTLVSLLGAVILHDYRAMAYGLLACVTANVIVSHLMASDRWRLGWHRETARESMKYGGPLALNGMAFAVTNLGDRTLTGATISLAQLAQYTALATSAFLPRSAVLKYLNSVFTPHFVNATDADGLRRIGWVWLVSVSTIAGVFGLGYFALGQIATTLVFGHAYHPPQTIVSLIALLGAVRYMAGLPTPPSLALGRNSILVRATLLSTSGLAIGAALLAWSPSLDHLVFGLTIGESAALCWVTLKISNVIHIGRRAAFFAVFSPLLMIAGMTTVTYLVSDPSIPARVAMVGLGSLLQICLTAVLIRISGVSLKDGIRFLFPRKKTLVV